MTEIDDDEQTEKMICQACIGDRYLAAAIRTLDREAACSYCNERAPSVTIEELADQIETAFANHYKRTADQPDGLEERMNADPESDYWWSRSGSPAIEAIQEAAGIDEEPASDVLEILQHRHGDFDVAAAGEESEFDGDAHYSEKGPNDQAWREEWDRFELMLKSEARFFSHAATRHLARVFGGIDQLKTHDDRPLVVDAGPQTALDHLFRARVFQAEEPLTKALERPDLNLGSPPASVARPGRMNALGISVFYGATTAPVAIAEVRPPVGSRVVVARFDISRFLRLLDLTALDAAHDHGSVFDPTLKPRLERASFLRTLSRRMARAVMPDDEALEYLPTQAVADFLATMNEPRLDGILFPSPQTEAGLNVVLFHHAARVGALELPSGTTITANTGNWNDEGWETEYSVSETVPAGRTSKPRAPHFDPDEEFPPLLLADFPDAPGRHLDRRTPALRVDVHSVTVHHVNAVEVRTSLFSVARHRFERQAPSF